MKQDIHPEYRPVVFLDESNSTEFVIRSTVKTRETTEKDGETLPLIRLETSSASHPFFTGSQKFIDTEGRIERFRKRYAKEAAAEPDADTEAVKEEG